VPTASQHSTGFVRSGRPRRWATQDEVRRVLLLQQGFAADGRGVALGAGPGLSPKSKSPAPTSDQSTISQKPKTLNLGPKVDIHRGRIRLLYLDENSNETLRLPGRPP